MSPKRNVELKARCPHLEGAERASLAHGARFAGVLIQTDTYFNAPNGRLKLRQIEPDRAELIWYERLDILSSRPSSYLVVPVEEPEVLRATLARALGIRGQVRKRCRLLLWTNVRIHLDVVEELGNFIEFEVVLSDNQPESMGHEKIAELCRVLGIRNSDRVSGSYCDLLGI